MWSEFFFFGTTSRLKARAWGLSYGGACYVALEAIGTIAHRGFDNRHALKSANSSSYTPHTPKKKKILFNQRQIFVAKFASGNQFLPNQRPGLTD